jgi:hypothetical protein
MRRPTKKILVALVAVAAVAVGAGGAYAYWTGTGSGTGSATAASGTNTVTEVQTTVITTLGPNVAPITLAGTFTNSGTTKVYVTNVTVSIASAYSVRGVPDARVSTPIRWDEIDDITPPDFTIATVPARFAERGDLHAGIDDAVFSIEPLLEWAARDEREGAPDPGDPVGGGGRLRGARTGTGRGPVGVGAAGADGDCRDCDKCDDDLLSWSAHECGLPECGSS